MFPAGGAALVGTVSGEDAPPLGRVCPSARVVLWSHRSSRHVYERVGPRPIGAALTKKNKHQEFSAHIKNGCFIPVAHREADGKMLMKHEENT